MNILNVFNTRELATIVWAVIFFIWLLRTPAFFRSLLNFLKTLPRLWKILTSMITYIGLSIFVLYTLSLWNIGLLKITIFWFFGWAFFMLVHISKIESEKSYFRKTIVEIIGLTVVVSFIENFYTFSLFVELLLVPFVVLLVGVATVSEIKKEHLVNRIMNRILILVGLVVMVISIGEIAANFQKFITYATLQEFLLPILLSLMYLPYLYLLSRYIRYERDNVLSKIRGNRS